MPSNTGSTFAASSGSHRNANLSKTAQHVSNLKHEGSNQKAAPKGYYASAMSASGLKQISSQTASPSSTVQSSPSHHTSGVKINTTATRGGPPSQQAHAHLRRQPVPKSSHGLSHSAAKPSSNNRKHPQTDYH